ncbi:MAG TPA: VanW family protein [Anaerolineae bacterium]
MNTNSEHQAQNGFRPIRKLQRRASPLLMVVYGLVILGLAIGIVTSFTLLGYELYYLDRIVPGVSVLGANVGGMTRSEATKILQDRFKDQTLLLNALGGAPITLRDGDREFRAWPWEVGWRNDFAPALEAAFAVGHGEDLRTKYVERVTALVFGTNISAAQDFDTASAERYLDLLTAQIDIAPRDAKLTLSGLRAVETPAQKGRALDRVTTLKRIQARVRAGGGGEVEIAVKEIVPNVTETKSAKAQVENFLAVPLALSFDERKWGLDLGQLASLIQFRPADGKYSASLNHAALVALLQPVAREINQPVRDAKLHYESGTLIPLVTSQDGRLLDAEATAQAIEERFAQGKTARAGGAGSLSAPLDAVTAAQIPLVVRVTKPAIDLRDVSKFGIKEVVSVGKSTFFHSIPGRIQNIKTAAAQFSGVVVPPNGTFSFVQNLGNVVEANGYEDAYVIFGDRTVLGPGGGVCQVSSTAFRAAFWGGFPIVERWAHDYRVGYYEPPVGLDATVFAPSVDFKFKNDTGAYLLIETQVDEKNFELTFTFYGTKPNRKVTMEDPVVTNIIKAPTPLYQNDATLKKGVVKQVDFSADGEDVTLYRVIDQNGQVTREKFFSRYKPWRAVFMVGTRVQ